MSFVYAAEPLAADVGEVQFHNDAGTVVNISLWKAKEQNGPIR